jgi:farnesyl-diphosphate farnesyltransferase
VNGAGRAINDADRAFCRAMLPKVSRTFAACIDLLPAPLDYQVLIAYLLCRIADTVEDTAALPCADKQRLLARFRDSLDEGGPDVAPLAEVFADAPGDDGQLTREAERTLREFRAFAPEVRAAIRPWVQEMCDGMAGFAAMQPRPGDFRALERVADLDRYCWYVAGTVGHLLTELFRLQSPRIGRARYERLKARATDFGLGLQLVNIIKDVADDRQRGWSFVPRELCAEAGIAPEDLLDPARAEAARAVMGRMTTKARAHLDAALAYCTSLPAADYRIRLFCLAPLYFAVRTLALAERDPRLLDPAHKVKITRREVYRTLATSHLVAISNPLVTAYYSRLARRGA